MDFTERQFGRIIGDDGQPVRKDFERFRPSVGPNDLFLFGSVGDDADNAPEDVFKVKKLLQRAAGTEFRPGIEGLGEAGPRTVNTLKNIQRTNNLKVDGRVEPGGPTLHALGFRALGPEDGRPTPLAAHEFETRFGKPADKDESRRPITSSAAATESAFASRFDPKVTVALRSGRAKVVRELLRRLWRRFKQLPNDAQIPWPPSASKRGVVKSPARIIKYPNGRVYLSVGPDGRVHRMSKAGRLNIHKLDRRFPLRLKAFQRLMQLPEFDDKQSHEERRAAGLEGYVYGPKFDKAGRVTGYVPLFDPSSLPFRGNPAILSAFQRTRLLRSPTGEDIFLTIDEIKSFGLWHWYSTTDKPVVERD